MRIAIGADHAGFRLKGEIARLLDELGYPYHDFGAYDDALSDYPDFARLVAQAMAKGDFERGILVCGNGVGVCITANKVPGIRAALCHDTLSARQSVEHDDANVLCLGERIIGPELALEIVRIWLAANFSGKERYRRRLEKIRRMEQVDKETSRQGNK
jgi:ribose 5-phosphate isomerase B